MSFPGLSTHVFLTAAICLLTYQDVWASCVSISPQEALDASDVAFIGTPISRDEDGYWQILVNRGYKDVDDGAVVIVNPGGLDLSSGEVVGESQVEFEVNRFHLVYGAGTPPDTVTADACLCRSLGMGIHDVVALEAVARDDRDYDLAGFHMSEGQRLNEWSLRQTRHDAVRDGMVAVLSDQTDLEVRSERFLLHNVGTGKQVLVVQVFEPIELSGSPLSSAEVCELLQSTMSDKPEELAAALAVGHPGRPEVFIWEPLKPCDDQGARVYGWFTRDEDRVGLADLFALADAYGTTSADSDFDSTYDIVENDAVDLADFFLFADNCGKNVLNAELFIERTGSTGTPAD